MSVHVVLNLLHELGKNKLQDLPSILSLIHNEFNPLYINGLLLLVW